MAFLYYINNLIPRHPKGCLLLCPKLKIIRKRHITPIRIIINPSIQMLREEGEYMKNQKELQNDTKLKSERSKTMEDKKLKEIIEQTQKICEENKDWKVQYANMANAMLENQELIQKFYREIKNYEHLQFYLTGVSTTQPTIYTISVKYFGQPVADISISNDEVHISTEKYNDTNKKELGCDIQLNGEWKTVHALKFLNYFEGDITSKNKDGGKSKIESLLLAEFSKTVADDKLMTGIQPIKFQRLFYLMPTLDSNINILVRTKVRRITIINTLDPTNENETTEDLLAKATEQAIFLINLLRSESGNLWYKIMGFKGQIPSTITIKVCSAIPNKLESKEKAFEPFQLKYGNDNIEYHYLYYGEGKNAISSLKTSLNE